MKAFLYVALAGVALAAACDSPSENEDVVQYDMVEFIGEPLPIEIGTFQDGACVDSLLAARIELISSSSARFTANESRNCSGIRSTRNYGRTGTYQMAGDTINFTWELQGDPIMHWMSEDAILIGDELEFRERVYTESDPDGSENFYVYASYRRR